MFEPAGRYGFLFNPDFQKLPKDLQSLVVAGETASSDAKDLRILLEDFNNPARRKQILEDQVAFQGELMKQAAPYKLLFDIPQTISQAFGNQAAMNVLGARSITDAYNTALQSYPRTQFTTTPYTPRNYFN